MQKTFVVTLAAGELEISLSGAEPPRWRFLHDDVELELDAVKLPSGSWSVIADGRSFLVDIENVGDRVQAMVDGRALLLTVEDAARRRLSQMVHHAAGRAKKGETVRAPIAGKVVKVAVAAGDEVAAGEPVVVLEAMKMENEIRATRGGVVTGIHVAAGDPVETGQVLLTLG